jgi:hypothetical protein
VLQKRAEAVAWARAAAAAEAVVWVKAAVAAGAEAVVWAEALAWAEADGRDHSNVKLPGVISKIRLGSI